MLDELTSANFVPYLNDSFLIHYGGDEPWETELIEISELNQVRGGDPDRDPPIKAFSVIFRSPRTDAYLQQNVYTVEHPILGQLDLFLVPIGPDKQGMRYEAVFS